MNKDLWKANQPGAKRILSHALRSGKLTHAYLFWGPKGAPAVGTAVLLAQSLLCTDPDEEGFACGRCPSCQAVAARRSSQVLYMDEMKKQDAVRLQSFFQQTSDRPRCCILPAFDKASPAVSNALLKFIEEPGQDITILMTADEKGAVLPTIESRCQCIQLRPANLQVRLEEASEIPGPLAPWLARLGYGKEDMERLCQQEDSGKIAEQAERFVKEWNRPAGLFHLQTELFAAKQPLTTRENIRIFFEILQAMNRQQSSDPQIQLVLNAGIDRIRKTADPLLCLDQTACQIRKVLNDGTS